MKKEIKIVKEENTKAKRFIKYNLHQYNVTHCDYFMRNSTKFHNNRVEGNFTIYDNGKIAGGVLGYIKSCFMEFSSAIILSKTGL